jgi:CarD family transcriptional regulator
MPFSVGDKIVHPGIGAGQIVGTKRQEFVEGFERYYVIELPGRESIVYIPVAKMDELGVRPVISETEAARVLETLSANAQALPRDYKERQGHVEDKLGSGSPIQIAEVVRDLAWRKHVAHLTKRDTDLLQRGRTLLAAELALVTDASVDHIDEVIDDALAPDEVDESDPHEPPRQAAASAQSSDAATGQQGIVEAFRRRAAKALGHH